MFASGSLAGRWLSLLRNLGVTQSLEADHDDQQPRIANSFADLTGYKWIEKHRALGRMMGVQDPFFRSHDARSGATTLIGGVEHINFASYDYLGLNQHPDVAETAKRAIDQYGTSVSASRIVAGEREFHSALEREIAEFMGVEDALVFVSGHATNVTTIGALMTPDDLIIHDELIHNSAIVGAQLSGAKRLGFRHNNLDALEKILKQNRSAHRNCLIVVEGVYSMDGDVPDLPRLVQLKDHYGAWLMVDEAHALGVLGGTGRGIAEHFKLDPRKIDIWMGTLSKTLAGCGGYIAGDKILTDLLRFNASGFVYSVGLSPPVATASLKALQVLRAEPERVARMQANGKLFLREAQGQGLDTATSEGYAVVPVMVGDTVRAVKLTERLLARGINALPILYPAVPLKGARIRFFVTSEHTPAQLRQTARITREELDALRGVKTAAQDVAEAAAA